MKLTNPLVTCAKCGGLGKMPLPFDLEQTFQAVMKIGDATVIQVKDVLDPKDHLHGTAFNNRLNDLVRFGLLERKRVSRNIIYSVTKKPKTKVKL